MENEPTSQSPKRDGHSLKRQIVHIDLRAANARRVEEMSKKKGALIQVLGGDRDCPACAKLDGEVFSGSELPSIPPENCTCLPYCTCVLTVIANQSFGKR